MNDRQNAVQRLTGRGFRKLLAVWEDRVSYGILLRSEAWMVLLAVAAALLLAVPVQVIELYRIIYADSDIAEISRLAVSVLVMGTSLGVSSFILASAIFQRQMGADEAIRPYARLLPFLLASLPPLACGLGHFAGLPQQLESAQLTAIQQVGSPWGEIPDQLRRQVYGNLTLFGWLYIAAALLTILWGCLTRRRAMPRFANWFALHGDATLILPFVLLGIFLLDLLFILSPVAIPRAIGSFGIAALFVAAVAINTCLLTLLSQRWRFPLIPALLLAGVVFSAANFNDNHVLRTVPGDTVPQIALKDGFNRWFRSRSDLARYQGDYPVYVVAVQGGGIYASYQAAIVLARLSDRCPEFQRHLFAISSVSGGSVGAAVYLAALRSRPPVTSAPDQSGWCRALSDSQAQQGPVELVVDQTLTDDHLAPLVAAALFPDYTQRFLPFAIAPLDRARALEKSFESSLRVHSGGEANLDASFSRAWRADEDFPALLVNTTDAGTGMRYLIAPFDIPAHGWKGRTIDNYPIWAKDSDLRLSTVSVASARFPWVTPAALVPVAAADFDKEDSTRRDTRMVDGGYVDNSGVETALDVIAQLAGFQPPPGSNAMPRPHFVLIAITTSEIPSRTSSMLGETLEPVRALLSTRSTRAYLALGRAYQQLKSQETPNPFPGQPPVISQDVRPIPLSNQFYKLPLGWRLSNQTANIIRLQSGRAWDCEPRLDMTQRVVGLSQADCVQAQVAAEISGTVGPALRSTAISNYDLPSDGSQTASRFDHEQFLRCYVDATHRPLTYRQARSGEAMLNEWDNRPDLHDLRWLAFMMALVDYNTVHMLPVSQRENRASLIARYGPHTKLGKILGNRTDDDAVRYLGRGFLYLTGRENYEAVAKGTGIDILSYPDLLLNRKVSARSMFFWVQQAHGRKIAPFIEMANPDWAGAWSKVNGKREAAGAASRVDPILQCLNRSNARPKSDAGRS